MDIEIHSATWRAIDAWADSALDEARAALEMRGLDPAESEHLRGRIAALRELQGLAAAPQKTPVVRRSEYGV